MTLRGRRPGDRRVRVSRHEPQEYRVAAPRRVRAPVPPALVLLYGFAAMIAVGTVLLALPISSQSGEPTRPLDALFTATSAVCVTGLVVLDTGTHWSGFGQAVIAGLIQAGGFGFMTSSTLLLLLVVRRRTRLRDRVLVQESIGTPELGNVTALMRRVAVFTLLAEGVGAAILTGSFLAGGEPVERSLWWGVFHAVSAFNNAGFDLTGGFRSLSGFVDDWVVLATVGALLVLGGLGYAIVGDVAGKRSWRRLALETKVVLLTTAALLAIGALLIGATEWSNPATLGALPPAQRALNAMFESATLRTAGFTALNTGAFEDPTLFIVMALMFIGGASGSTAGGIKVNTFSVLLIAIVSTVRGEPSATAFGRRLQHALVYRALAVALLAIAFVFSTALALALSSDAAFVQVVFEAVSAFGTVGASTGITPELGDQARLILVGAMFAGRLGPLTVVLALAARAHPVRLRPAVEGMRIG